MEIGQKTILDVYGKKNLGQRLGSKLGEDDSIYDYAVFDETFLKTQRAAFRQNNFIPSLMRGIESLDPMYKPEDGYSPENDEILLKKLGGRTDSLWRFRSSRSHEFSMLMYDRMKEDAEDQAYLASTVSGPAEFFASMVSPTTLAPIAPAKVLQTASRTRRFVGGSSFSFATMFPEQLLIESQNTQRDASHSALALTAASLLGGSFASLYKKSAVGNKIHSGNRFIDQSGNLKVKPEEVKEPVYRSAGANVSPEKARQAIYSQMEEEALEETGVGIEKLGWNPVLRMMKSPNPYVRGLATSMVDVGGMMQKKVRSLEEEMTQSVETNFRTKYMSKLLNVVRESDEAYLSYLGKQASSSDIGRSIQMMKASFSNKFQSTGKITETEFRNRVGLAAINGDVDQFFDEASEAVTKSARSYRGLFNYIKDEANKIKLWEKELDVEIQAAKNANNIEEVSRLQKQLSKIKEHGVTVNTAQSYRPRIYRIDKINADEDRFLSIVKSYGITTLRMSDKEADDFSKEVLDTVTHRRPYFDLEGVNDSLDFVKSPSGVKARTLEIPDSVLNDFLENDIEVLSRHHVKTMGMDIELTARFGSIDMKSVLEDISSEYETLLKSAKSSQERTNLKKSMENDVRDIRGLRDRLRGTYGASKDPHAMSSRFVRVMKSINVLTGMGSAVVSSVPDVARIVMVEGFENSYKNGFSTIFNRQSGIIKSMNKSELDKAAIAVDATLGLRAHAMADIGDLFGSRYTIERNLNSATGMMFFFNGLNMWNQALKEIAGNVTSLRMTQDIMKPWNKVSQANKEKFLKNGINQQDHMRMQMLIKEHGQNYKGEWLPNTDAWADTTMVRKFRNALNQNVERIIITPGAGDRALWTSTELGSLLTQFKSFGQGAMTRMLTAGLQEKDGAFWQGAFLIVGLAGIVNEIKRRQYGIETEENFDDKILNAVDRSGILGWFTDVNNSLEKISDYKLGMRPFLTDQPSYATRDSAKVSSVFGPSASQTMNIASILGDVTTFQADQDTLKNLRFSTPTGNVFYLDPIYDGVFGE